MRRRAPSTLVNSFVAVRSARGARAEPWRVALARRSEAHPATGRRFPPPLASPPGSLHADRRPRAARRSSGESPPRVPPRPAREPLHPSRRVASRHTGEGRAPFGLAKARGGSRRVRGESPTWVCAEGRGQTLGEDESSQRQGPLGPIRVRRSPKTLAERPRGARRDESIATPHGLTKRRRTCRRREGRIRHDNLQTRAARERARKPKKKKTRPPLAQATGTESARGGNASRTLLRRSSARHNPSTSPCLSSDRRRRSPLSLDRAQFMSSRRVARRQRVARNRRANTSPHESYDGLREKLQRTQLRRAASRMPNAAAAPQAPSSSASDAAGSSAILVAARQGRLAARTRGSPARSDGGRGRRDRAHRCRHPGRRVEMGCTARVREHFPDGAGRDRRYWAVTAGPRGSQFRRSCDAGRATLGIEANGAIKGCPSLPTTPWTGGNIRDASLEDIWERSEALRYTRDRTTRDLWGYCRSCYYAEECMSGCTWTSFVTLGVVAAPEVACDDEEFIFRAESRGPRASIPRRPERFAGDGGGDRREPLSWLLSPSAVVMPRRGSRGAVRRARGSL